MFYQCTGCFSLSYQPLAVRKGPKHFGCPKGPTVGPKCEFCKASFHLGGPIWTGLIHDKDFVREMQTNLMSQKFEYLGTSRRIEVSRAKQNLSRFSAGFRDNFWYITGLSEPGA